jgi:hypothetical protein
MVPRKELSHIFDSTKQDLKRWDPRYQRLAAQIVAKATELQALGRMGEMEQGLSDASLYMVSVSMPVVSLTYD